MKNAFGGVNVEFEPMFFQLYKTNILNFFVYTIKNIIILRIFEQINEIMTLEQFVTKYRDLFNKSQLDRIAQVKGNKTGSIVSGVTYETQDGPKPISYTEGQRERLMAAFADMFDDAMKIK